jgi:hypothetical protein
MASDSCCLSAYGVSEEWLDRDIEEIRSVAADERRSYGGILSIEIMDVLGVALRGGQRMAMAIDVFEAGPLAGEDDDLFELLQGGFDREYIEETPGPNFTVATIPYGAVLRLVEAIRRVNGSSERSNCFTRSMELVLVEASQPDRRLVIVAD